MSERRSAAFVVACPDCEERRATDDANETVAFYRRHRAATGHDVVWERAAFDGDDALPDGDLAAIVDELDGRHEDGVPIGVVAAALGARGVSMGETLERIRALRMRGGLYEPRDDHLRAT
ncbi:hypothetical protein ACFQPA_15380 [Halomarina halobia]|uniref:Uncharacterized protein n=1 Tax=Halomarina halobia TaxID=3033386 RepID=A0ABD6A979_9EURY|nr:hypothetical protein [Halomarina sp. PSR21]